MSKFKEMRFAAPTAEKNLWFTSDTHYGHKAILRPDYSGRPFATIDDMNEALIANWNAAVGPEDTVFHLGDFCMGGPRFAANVARRLNGHRVIVYGNHDLKMRGVSEVEELFERVIDFGCQIKVEDADAYQRWQRITLCHYAFRIWNKSHFGSWDLYGHSHANLAEPQDMLSMDVGVDAVARRFVEPQSSHWSWKDRMMPESCRPEYRPISYAEVKAVMATRKWKPIDHHRRDEAVDE